MERLSYLATFVSLIYGLGVANVLAHFASLIKRGRDADWYWVHTLWSVYLLLLMASMWWVLQNWAAVPHIGYFSYLSLLLLPSLAFVASDLLFPERSAAGAIDLRAHFSRVRRAFFLLLLVMLLCDELDSALKGWDHVVALGPAYWSVQVYWYFAIFVGLRSRSDRVLGALACVGIALLLAAMSNILPAT